LSYGQFSKGYCALRLSQSHAIVNCDDPKSPQGFYSWCATMPHRGKNSPYDEHNSKSKKRDRTQKTSNFEILMNLIIFYGCLEGFHWSSCSSGGNESMEEDYFVRNDPGTVMALQQCGLLNFFKIQGMRAQLRLLKYLVHMWDVN